MNPIVIATDIAGNAYPYRRWRETWWEYDPRRYRYVEKCSEEFRAELLNLLHDVAPRRQNPESPELCSCHRRNDVEEALKWICMIDKAIDAPCWVDNPPPGFDKFVRCTNFVSFDGGLLDVDGWLQRTPSCVLPATSDFFCLSSLDYAFNPTAQCPQFEKFLNELSDGDNEIKSLLQEWTGYCLVPDVRLQKFLVLVGDGANGKSVFADVLRGVIGVDNCSSLSLSQLNSRFGRAGLVDKLLNISDELSASAKPDEEMLKTVVGGSPIAVDRKYKAMMQVVLPTRLMFTTNALPHFSDRTDGIWRRMMLVPCNAQMPESRQDRDLAAKLLEERSGILNWALEGLRRLRNNGAFTVPASSKVAIHEHRMTCNPLREFLDEEVVLTPPGSTARAVSVEQLVERYRHWAHRRGRTEGFKGPAIGTELRRKFPVMKTTRGRDGLGKRIRHYVGLAFVDDIAEEEQRREQERGRAELQQRSIARAQELFLRDKEDDERRKTIADKRPKAESSDDIDEEFADLMARCDAQSEGAL